MKTTTSAMHDQVVVVDSVVDLDTRPTRQHRASRILHDTVVREACDGTVQIVLVVRANVLLDRVAHGRQSSKSAIRPASTGAKPHVSK